MKRAPFLTFAVAAFLAFIVAPLVHGITGATASRNFKKPIGRRL